MSLRRTLTGPVAFIAIHAASAALAIAAALALLSLGSGCDDSDASEGVVYPAPRAVLASGETLLFGGWVDDWCWVPEETLRAQIDAMQDAGWDGYLIEMGGSARWRGHTEEEARAILAERYSVLVDMLAARRMKLLNSIQNDNAGKGKYGDKSPPLSKQTAFSHWLVNLVSAVGRPDVVLVQPVAETESAAGFALEQYCATVLTNFTLVNNAGSRPDERPTWAHYNADHPWSIEKTAREDIVVNDTSTFIRELDANGNMTGATNPDRVMAAYQKCRSLGVKLFGLYLFDAGEQPEIDHATITKMMER